MVEDNWQHRAKGMKCAICMWFVAKPAPDAQGKLGRCRRHAPTMSGYPAVFDTDWCGDHKLDETKLGDRRVFVQKGFTKEMVDELYREVGKIAPDTTGERDR